MFQTLLSTNVVNSHPGMLDLVYQFLEHIVWEKERSQFARKVHKYNSKHHYAQYLLRFQYIEVQICYKYIGLIIQ